MNTPVSFEIKQLLYDKGWRYELGLDETGYKVKNSLAEQRWNEGNLTYVDIAISEVVMWLYEKHGIWIYALRMDQKEFYWSIDTDKREFTSGENFKTPTEAYEAAIEYTLKNFL